MVTSANLALGAPVITPGETGTITVTVFNSTDIVEAYTFEILGALAPWAVVEPARISLYPGTSGNVVVSLQPPRSPEVPVGQVPVGVRVLPAEHPENTVVLEETVVIAPYLDAGAELVPQAKAGRRSARYAIRLDNRGNDAAALAVDGVQGSDDLTLTTRPGMLTLPPGQATESELTVRAHKLLWFGKPVTKPFQVRVNRRGEDDTAIPDAPPAIVLDGTFTQRPVLPRWLLALLGLLLALLALWFGLVRPAVNSAARQAVDDKTNQIAEAGGLSPGQGGNPGKQQGKGGPGQQTGTGQDGQNNPDGPNSGGDRQQFDTNIQVQTNPGQTGTNAYTVPDGKVFRVTDMLLSNFQGDEGRVTIKLGDRTIATIALETFRNQDYHWVTPVDIDQKATASVTVTCTKTGVPPSGAPAPNCTELVTVNGFLVNKG
ncbi:hydrolytic protein [Amycolatopsis anabasis]|uniref:COG1470 family protein n=1 Tax=Amycolatopsis anabasis TaxID=1840409 RepID=UPI001C550BB7|nr:hydrolytic protein [Amycolatopsis anabasis]